MECILQDNIDFYLFVLNVIVFTLIIYLTRTIERKPVDFSKRLEKPIPVSKPLISTLPIPIQFNFHSRRSKVDSRSDSPKKCEPSVPKLQTLRTDSPKKCEPSVEEMKNKCKFKGRDFNLKELLNSKNESMPSPKDSMEPSVLKSPILSPCNRFLFNSVDLARYLPYEYHTQVLKLNADDPIEKQKELENDINEFTNLICNYDTKRYTIYHFIFTNYIDFVALLYSKESMAFETNNYLSDTVYRINNRRNENKRKRNKSVGVLNSLEHFNTRNKNFRCDERISLQKSEGPGFASPPKSSQSDFNKKLIQSFELSKHLYVIQNKCVKHKTESRHKLYKCDLNNQEIKTIMNHLKIPLTEFLVIMFKMGNSIKFMKIIGCGNYNCVIKIKMNDEERILRITYDDVKYRKTNYERYLINKEFLKIAETSCYFPKIYCSSLSFISRDSNDYQTYIPSLWYVEKVYSHLNFIIIKDKLLDVYVDSVRNIIHKLIDYGFKFYDWKIDNLMFDRSSNVFVLIDFDVIKNVNDSDIVSLYDVQQVAELYADSKCQFKFEDESQTSKYEGFKYEGPRSKNHKLEMKEYDAISKKMKINLMYYLASIDITNIMISKNEDEYWNNIFDFDKFRFNKNLFDYRIEDFKSEDLSPRILSLNQVHKVEA